MRACVPAGHFQKRPQDASETTPTATFHHVRRAFTDGDIFSMFTIHHHACLFAPSMSLSATTITTGFWAFIDCANGEPFLCNFNQTAYIDRVLGWAYTRKMYAIIDIHALPGSHNGEVTSGHLTRNPTFFQDANQQRSKDTVKAALQYITNSPYRSIISALQVINEVSILRFDIPFPRSKYYNISRLFIDA